ncbi:hypothetical protein CACET_c31650 [Clostridium aceticum]|uniref:Uncharacterized protein n=1 Tax=Clostridium aceticum TaxID=84022 RepID=A0A0D8I760_9CLOT|nr:hypothetical protein [Clostridium aceticum]AKL96609.1 hypothetical protein CACET_c31650 [Clostridium aceticum]KJF26083.1 hypothetical protein TZ02_15300 [Clostridium aceticum]
MDVLNKKTRRENEKIIVTKTIEEKFTVEDLQNLHQHIIREKQGIIAQSKKLQERYAKLVDNENEVKEYITMLNQEKELEIEIKDT